MKDKRRNRRIRMIVDMAIKMYNGSNRQDVLNFMVKSEIPFHVAKRISRKMDKENSSKTDGIPL